jgi:predicted phage terminase large subunit-like protein
MRTNPGKMDLTQKELKAILRLDFCALIERCFYQLNPQTQFLRNWHIELIAAKLEACRRGDIRRLIINVPPRSLKSLCASVALPAWLLGHNPATPILCVSYAQDLSDKLARDCRGVMMSSWYQRTFNTRLSAQKQSVQEFTTTAQGYRMATSVGGVLTGRGADFIIIDDPLKPADALSEPLRRSANDWYDNTLFSRLNDKRTGCIILIMQRLHEDDLVGHILEREAWEVLSLPAIAEQDETFSIETLYGRRQFARAVGQALHPARESLKVLRTIRATLGEYNFASQYQQTPAPLEGGLVKRSWFKTYTKAELPERFDQILDSWDTANKPTQLADYSVCTTWGIKKKQIYLLHVFRKRLGYPDLKRAVLEQAEIHRATIVLIEDKASGTQLIQELIKEGLRIVKAVKPEADKIMRFNAQTATIENGFVYVPQQAPWLAEYIHEITTFPSAKYDDQADSTSQALAWINQSPPESSIFAYYRLETGVSLYRQGMSLAAASARAEVSEAELEEWLKQKQAKELEVMYERAFQPRCAKCGERFPMNSQRTHSGGLDYHDECYRKMTYGF